MTCSFEGCDNALGNKGGKGMGLCVSHYVQLRRGGELKPLAKRAPKGSPDARTYKPGRSAAIRAWARDQGYDVSPRGPIPEHIELEYMAQ
ncbi:Lsr2 family protein [Cellulomonas sp. DKR-3]|uniref:Lsr2 family protein n=1 Tax=Cellulomonas fulva TaxID=2835530 RepID=A0ABS5U2D5_9CELL|nr:histone-like nucleoid-structuring protein Lsr2 [Cellulomonas fulva]MBT0995471.1 Lsr2 family protein [Cellulomonas fulva]